MDNEKLSKTFNKLFTTLFLLSLSHFCYHSYQKYRIKDYWVDYKRVKRELSPRKGRFPSSQLLFEGASTSLSLLKPYFQFKTFDKYLDYKLDIVVSTSQNNTSLDSKIKDLLKETFNKVISSAFNNNSISEVHVPKEDILFKNIINKAIDQLRKNEINEGIFKIDLNFIPKISPHLNYNQELSSHRLINWSSVKSHELELDKSRDSLIHSVYNSKIPYNKENFQYNGGQISIQIEFPSLENSIPESSLAKTKGFIRYRKYYKAPHLLSNINLKGTNQLTFHKSYFKPHQNREAYVTVDLFQKFNTQNIEPQLDRVEFTFGNLLEENTKDLDTSIYTGDLILEGIFIKEKHPFSFITGLKTLIFDFQQGTFIRDSKLKINIKTQTNTPQQRGRLQNEIQQYLINDLAIELIQKLKLGAVQDFKGNHQ